MFALEQTLLSLNWGSDAVHDGGCEFTYLLLVAFMKRRFLTLYRF